MFVDVNPAQATPEAPKNAKFYAAKNSRAANPDPTADTDVPQINGKQADVLKTEDTKRAKFDQLQPDFAALAKERCSTRATPRRDWRPITSLVIHPS